MNRSYPVSRHFINRKLNFYIIFIFYNNHPRIGMFENGELGPSISPLPVFINNPLPVFIYNPVPIEIPFGHGDRYKPSPAAFILPAIPPLLTYNTPDPLILSMTFEAAAEPTPAKAPVARPGSTLERRNFPAVARNGNIAPMNPPSTLAL